jgi:hypothetical protein
MYAITAQIETRDIKSGNTAWHGSRQVPTFYLDEHVQGIVGEDHAARIALDVLNPLGALDSNRIHVTAVKIS